MEQPTNLVFAGEFGPGEALLRAGRPRQGLMVTTGDAFAIPFSLLWAGFAVVWEVTAVSGGAPFFFAIFGGAFVVMGAYIAVGRFVWDAWQRGRTYYALTDRRALIVRDGGRRSVTSTDLRQMGMVEVREHRGGRATVTFGPSKMPFGGWLPAGWPMAEQYRPAAFQSVEDGRRVYELLRDAQYRAVYGVGAGGS